MSRKSPIKVKVCGMRDESNIHQIAALNPDYMGFIFYEKSSRFVGPDFIMPPLPANVKKVGVFVNATADEMLRVRDRYEIQYFQLHGNETPSQVKELKKSGVTIVKVFSVDENFDFKHSKAYAEFSDYFLFDTKGKYYGGNAIRFDWRILGKYDQEVPFFLSGGLSPENISEVGHLSGMNIHAVDINSGVEISPTLKSREKIIDLINNLEKINIENNVL